MMKKVFVTLLMFVLCVGMLVFPVSAQNDEIKVFLNGQQITFDVYPQIISGRTMVPIRAIFEAMGASVEWDGTTRTATCQRGSTVVKMSVGSATMYINETAVSMDIAPLILNNRTLAPARFVAEAFGGVVGWNGETRTVDITLSGDVLVNLYSLDGQVMQVPESQVASHLTKGWALSPDFSLQTLYAPDGKVIQVYPDEVAVYLNIGWYLSEEAASRAHQEATYQPNPTTANTSSDYYTDEGTYKTAGGKEYHFDQNCAGDGSYRTRLEDVKRAGLTPCPKCAW